MAVSKLILPTILVILMVIVTGSVLASQSKRKERRLHRASSEIGLRHEDRWLEKQEKGQLPREISRLLERKGTKGKKMGRKSPVVAGRQVPHAPVVLPPANPEAIEDTILAAWVKHYSSGLAPSLDAATAVTYDGSGNIYVTGYTTGIFSGSDFYTAKFNSAGVLQWSATYNGTAYDFDAASAIAVDGSGNVYVTGSSFGIGLEEDFATIKYNSAGVQLWIARYNGPANDYDAAAGVRVDASGNVYVTGTSYGVITDADYATVKYNSSGVQLWVARYDGGISDYDAPAGLGIDLAGSVYVSGTSYGLDSYEDFTTVKYSFTGAQVWVSRYDGTGNDYDVVTSVTSDISGNTYITGGSYNIDFDSDYMTIKYDTFGDSDWGSRYNGPAFSDDTPFALTIDAARNVYVTGASYGIGSSENYVTIKYSSTGSTRWTSIYNGPGNSIDVGMAIAVDGPGNVYVTGSSIGGSSYEDFATVKYSSLGVQHWVARYAGPSVDYDAASTIAVDGSGNVVVGGVSYGTVSDEDIAIVRYSATGVEQWVSRYNGEGNSSDEAEDLVLDASGNAILTGTSYDIASQSDYATVKYDGAGNQLWVARYNGTGDAEDFVSRVEVDPSGNVYITGTSYGLTTGYDITTLKYSSAGSQLWVARYTSSGIATDEAIDLKVDAAGNAYVTGSRFSAASQKDYVTIKYSTAGTQLWVSAYNGTGNGDDNPASIDIDGSGNVYVTGASRGTTSGVDIATIKYNSSGVQQWASRYTGVGDSVDRGVKVDVDALSNVYVGGVTYAAATGNDYILVKYNSSGVQQWLRTHSSPGASNDYVTDAIVDASNNIYISGSRFVAASRYDFHTIKYDGSGNSLWSASFNSVENDDDAATALALDNTGNLYVTGYSFNFKSGDDIYTLKYTPTGIQRWSTRFNSPADFTDEPRRVVVDASGNVYIAGFSETEDGSVYTLAKYSAAVYSVNKIIMTFGSVTTGCRTDDTVRVRNADPVNSLVVYSIVSTDPNFIVSPSHLTVPPSDSLPIGVRFAPVSAGAKSGKIILTHSGITSPDTVNLSGTATGSGTATVVSVTLGEKWRLFSLPVNVVCPFVVPLSYKFSGQYIRSDTILTGIGYWTKLVDPVMTFTGFSAPLDTIPVTTGWNLVGSITTPFSVAGIETSPDSIISSAIFGYSGTYVAADSIKAGFGYWVKSRQPGVLYFQAGTAPSPNAIVPSEILERLDALEIVDAEGTSQRLYVGVQGGENVQESMFELPPTPPDGAFDVRFSNDDMVRFVNPSGLTETGIKMQGLVFPVTISVVKTNGNLTGFVRAGAQEIPLTSSSSIQLETPAQVTLVTGFNSEQPASFNLYQNYPNPFNSKTIIRYGVPEAANVTLLVYDLLGRVVRRLVDEVQPAGQKVVTWDGTDDMGKAVASGVYLCRMQGKGTPNFIQTRKMVLLK